MHSYRAAGPRLPSDSSQAAQPGMLTRQESTTPSVLKTGTLLKEGASPPWSWHSHHFILEDACLKCAGRSTTDFGLAAATLATRRTTRRRNSC